MTFNFASITDGLSNTIAMSERAIGGNRRMVRGGQVIDHTSSVGSTPTENQPSSCMSTLGVGGQYHSDVSTSTWAGLNWAHGGVARTQFNTILPPNGPSCGGSSNDSNRALVPPTSYHPGGVLALMCDGAVTFVSETIDTGNLSLPSELSGPSPYGVWGAMGSKDGGEVYTHN